MASGTPADGDHAALMDRVYRRQRHIYDLTRRYYLFGRDRLIAGLDAAPGTSVLEIACGTGRNLARVGKRWPDTRLFGVDISSEMLKSARETLGTGATLAMGDARWFDPRPALGEAHFDRIILSYSLSMIPDWRAALAHSASLLAPGGSLHVVDFGDLGGLPAPVARLLRAWLARFHVEPRAELIAAAREIAGRNRLALDTRRGRFGYYRGATLRAPR